MFTSHLRRPATKQAPNEKVKNNSTLEHVLQVHFKQDPRKNNERYLK